jgi:hypothetical protein
MSATERRKGAKAELEIAELLRDHWPKARRTSDGRDQHARGDIAHGPPGVHLEVKRQERLNVPAAVAQAERDASPGDIPVVAHRPSRSGWMATLPLCDLLELLALREAA